MIQVIGTGIRYGSSEQDSHNTGCKTNNPKLESHEIKKLLYGICQWREEAAHRIGIFSNYISARKLMSRTEKDTKKSKLQENK